MFVSVKPHLVVRHPVLRSGQHTQALLHWYSFSCLRGVAECLCPQDVRYYTQDAFFIPEFQSRLSQKKKQQQQLQHLGRVWENISINPTSNFNLPTLSFNIKLQLHSRLKRTGISDRPTETEMLTLDTCQECCISEHWPSVDIARSEKGGCW